MASPFENKHVFKPPAKPKISFGQIQLKKPSEPVGDKDAETESEEPQVIVGFSSFSYEKPGSSSAPDSSSKAKVEEDEGDDQMSRIMGFSSFDSSKKEVNSQLKKTARNFDVKEMAEAIRKSKAQERTEKTVSQIITPGSDDDDDDEAYVERSVKSRENAEENTTVMIPEDVSKPANSDDEDISSDDDEERVRPAFPIKQKRVLTHGTKPVTALAIDPAATRFATGSIDYEVKLWDFTGLKNGHAFRALKPCESHLIKNLSYSLNGESLLIIGGNCQAKVVDRDGGELLECIKGDQYIVDMTQTKGHVAALTGGQFNPKQKEIFLTCSDDGTCRLWDVNAKIPRYHKTCVKLRGYTGMKNPATTCCFSRDGYLIFAAGRDGCINMWDTRRKLVVPTATIKNAHARNSDTFAIVNSHSGNLVTSRGEDSVVNIWDTRKLTTTLWKDSNFGAKYNTTDLTFSPDDKYLLIPTLPGGQTGRDKTETLEYSELRFLNMADFTCKAEDTIKFPGDLVIRTAWNHRINQIFCTFSSGTYSIAYDLHTSHRGALLSHGKGPKKQRKTDMVEDFSNKIIITPNALPMFKTDKPRNRQREEMKARMDPTKSKRPDLPITAGTMGRVGTSGSTLSSYVIRNLGMSKSVLDDMDPREAILRYAKDAAENPIWVTPAYQKTQPTPIFQKPDDDDGPDAKKPKIL